MWTYEKALKVMRCYISVISDGEWEVLAEHTIFKPYGWVFFYNAKDIGSDGDDMLAGNAPIIFDRVNGEVISTGTAHNIDYYLKRYEKSIPKARMQMSPQGMLKSDA